MNERKRGRPHREDTDAHKKAKHMNEVNQYRAELKENITKLRNMIGKEGRPYSLEENVIALIDQVAYVTTK